MLNATLVMQMPTIEPAVLPGQPANGSQGTIVATPIGYMLAASPPFPDTVVFPDIPQQQVKLQGLLMQCLAVAPCRRWDSVSALKCTLAYQSIPCNIKIKPANHRSC